jgi:hypothetical protein
MDKLKQQDLFKITKTKGGLKVRSLFLNYSKSKTNANPEKYIQGEIFRYDDLIGVNKWMAHSWTICGIDHFENKDFDLSTEPETKINIDSQLNLFC